MNTKRNNKRFFRNLLSSNLLCHRIKLKPILGDPGATSRDEAIFSGERHFWRESLLQGLKSPWALFLTKRVPEVSNPSR